MQGQVHHGLFAAHGGSRALEAAGKQVDEDDLHDAGVPHVLAELIRLFLDGVAGRHQHRHCKAGQQGHMPRECAEGALGAQYAQDDAGTDVQRQEHEQRQERKPAEVFLFAAQSFAFLFHVTTPFLFYSCVANSFRHDFSIFL